MTLAAMTSALTVDTARLDRRVRQLTVAVKADPVLRALLDAVDARNPITTAEGALARARHQTPKPRAAVGTAAGAEGASPAG